MADKIKDELEALQLEQTRFEVSRMRGEMNNRKIRQRSVEAALNANEAQKAQTIAGCAHRKGGKGVEMIYRGNDSNYAVVKHQLPHGPIIIVCQRCPKVWYPPDAALIARGATAEMRRLYAKQQREYMEALNYPTDNEMSGSQLFMVTRTDNPDDLQVAS